MLFLFFFLCSSNLQSDKQIQLSIESTFPSSLFAECLLYFGEFQKSSYSKAISIINKNFDSFVSIESTKDISMLFQSCLTDFDTKFLQYLLDFHYFIPRIEFYSNTYKSNSDINKNIYEFEPSGLKNIQYIDFSIENLKKIKQLPENTIIRPIITKTDEFKSVNLNGWGVEFRPFKYSMEYGVKDNKKQQKSNNAIMKDSDKEFLLQYDPQGRIPSPERLRKSFLSFLYQTDEKFETLKTITENWPIAAEIVATEEPDLDIEADVDEEKSIVRGTNEGTLNGRVINFDTFDPFTFAESIHEIKTVKKILNNSFNINKKNQIENLLEHEIKQPQLVIDIRECPILWVNDLENDKRYSKFHRKLDTLFGSLSEPPKIQKNIVNLVLFIDFNNKKDIELLMDAHKMIEKGYAMRLGIVPLLLYDQTDDSEKQTAIQYSQMFYDLFEGNYNKFKFMSLVVKSKGDIKKAFENITKKNPDVYSFSDESSEYAEKIQEFLEYSGIKQHSVWCNGDLYIGLDDLTEALLVAPMESVRIVREIAAEQTASISNFLDLVLSKRKPVKRRIQNIHIDKPIVVSLSECNYEKNEEFISFLKSIDFSSMRDDDESLVTVIIHARNNKDIFEDEIKSFLKRRHRVPCRFAFVESFPDFIESNPIISASNHFTDATFFVNGRLINLNYTFDNYNELVEWQSSISQQIKAKANNFINSFFKEEKEREDFLCYWTTYILSLEERGITIKHFHPNLFDSESPAVVCDENEESDISIKLIMNPFTKEFTKMIGFINKLREYKLADISLRLNTPNKLDQVPQSFYRYVVDDTALFSIFNDSITYSVILETPETWMVEQKRADIDLDNVLAYELAEGAYKGVYSLTNLVVEGFAVNEFNQPSDSVSIFAGKEDTTTMGMNGYWQLKLNPGLYNINLVGGYSSDNYLISDSLLTLSSFSWRMKNIVIRKKEGVSINSSGASFNAKDDGKIHIFGVSSGLLYERLTRIMILSAVKRSGPNATCKFWLLKNFMSPSFKELLPFMAKEYKFEYELVTYHWPYWLQRQTEKQRIIWGNKILFLDVLFPLSLKRVIYIDADQVVRTNMRELMEMDFHGAPYAFTPMCNNREETEPFRFWKIGYWKEHLQGKPYHISALYAVDLNIFRQMKAGDTLRHYYSQLVQDPQSLANLDQDLPNYAQNKIPIYSLPQNWLWCETWCSDDTMSIAKTIDLCNNPLTKAPKLYIAQTRIEEWPSLDAEVKAFEGKIKAGEKDETFSNEL